MADIAIENGPFIVDLPTKNGDFNSYVGLPKVPFDGQLEKNWSQKKSRLWRCTEEMA